MVQCFMQFGHIITGCCVYGLFIACSYIPIWQIINSTFLVMNFWGMRIGELMYYTYKDHKINTF